MSGSTVTSEARATNSRKKSTLKVQAPGWAGTLKIGLGWRTWTAISRRGTSSAAERGRRGCSRVVKPCAGCQRATSRTGVGARHSGPAGERVM